MKNNANTGKQEYENEGSNPNRKSATSTKGTGTEQGTMILYETFRNGGMTTAAAWALARRWALMIAGAAKGYTLSGPRRELP